MVQTTFELLLLGGLSAVLLDAAVAVMIGLAPKTVVPELIKLMSPKLYLGKA